MSTTMENLTEAVQRHLGVQQAQTMHAENITADALARLHGARGNIDRILELWKDVKTAGPDLVRGFEPHHADDLRRLRDVLDVSFKVQGYSDGRARTFLPLSTKLINGTRGVSTLYRDVGRSVVEALWTDHAVAEQLKAQTRTWERSHPLARLLAPLADALPIEAAKGDANLKRVMIEDEALAAWRDRVVLQDWRAWLSAAEGMSSDEQLETMTSLIGLHLFSSLMHRLALEPDGSFVPRLFFVAVDGQSHNRVASRAGTSFYAHWRDRADVALRIVADRAITDLAEREVSFAEALESQDWTRALMWRNVGFGKGRKQKAKYEERLEEKLEQARAQSAVPQEGDVRRIVEDTLCEVFSTGSNVTSKVKDFLRTTGAAAGLVGPIDRGVRKRFLLSERGLILLARLHANRPAEEIASAEEDKQSVEAFLDDIFDRYGILVTLERERIRARVFEGPDAMRLARMLPNEEAVRRNREQLELRLDALRLVRRYSDASTVIHIPR
ncbi:MAG: hypothetical protein RLP09_17050 [Sandaracinaceae bacterium]